jgi:hypothetical protein
MARVYQLLSLTALSLLNQRDTRWRWIICANVLPSLTVCDPRIEFEIVDFPPVNVKTNSDKSQPESFKFDKGSKLLSAWLRGGKYKAKYIVSLDSDDWVHCDFVGFLNDSVPCSLWHVGDGYIVNFSAGKRKLRAGMVRYCGSGFAFSSDFLLDCSGLSLPLTMNLSQDQMAERTRSGFITDFLGDHHLPYRYSAFIGQSSHEIPFPSVSWIVNHGVNFSETTGFSRGRSLDERFLSDFGLLSSVRPGPRESYADSVFERIGYFRSAISWRLSKHRDKWVF